MKALPNLMFSQPSNQLQKSYIRIEQHNKNNTSATWEVNELAWEIALSLG
jgi:hypothetical protein